MRRNLSHHSDSSFDEVQMKHVQSNIQFFARIKPPAKNQDKNEVNIFSATEEKGNTVVTAKTGIKLRLIQNYYKTEDDFENIKDVFLEKIEPYRFNGGVYNMYTGQEQVYKDTCKELVGGVFAGENASILIFGPTNCGKSHAFAGGEKIDKGIIYRSVDDLLNKLEINQRNSTKNIDLKVGVFCIFNDDIIDLLAPEVNSNLKVKDIYEKSLSSVKIIGLTKKEVKFKSDFKLLYSNAMKNIISLGESEKEPDFYSKSHVIVQCVVTISSNDGRKEQYKLNIARLADIDVYDPCSDQQVVQQNDFAILQRYVNQCQRQKSSATANLYKNCKLTYALRDTLNESSRTSILCCVGSVQQNFQQSLISLDYFDKLQQNIQYQKPPLSPSTQPFNYEIRERPQKQSAYKEKGSRSMQIHTEESKNYDYNIMNAGKTHSPVHRAIKKQLKTQSAIDSPPQSNRILEEIKNKEDKLDKDFVRLLERYNHSKELIDNLCGNTTVTPSMGGGLNSIRSSPQKVYELPYQGFDKPRNLSPPTSEFAEMNYRSESGLKKNTRKNLNYMTNQPAGNNSEPENQPVVSKSLKKLKKTIQMKESIEKDKYQRQASIFKEMKQACRDYIQKNQDLQEIVVRNEDNIVKLESNLDQATNEVTVLRETVKDYKYKEESWNRTEEELNAAVLNLHAKLSRKKKKMEIIRMESQNREKLNKETCCNYDQNINKLEKLCEEYVEAIKSTKMDNENLNINFSNLQQEHSMKHEHNNLLSSQLDDKHRAHNDVTDRLEQEIVLKSEVQNHNSQLQTTQEQLKDMISQLEAKIQKLKLKQEDEKRVMNEDKQTLVMKKKNKIQRLKSVIDSTRAEKAQIHDKHEQLTKQLEHHEQQIFTQSNNHSQLQQEKAELHDSHQQQIHQNNNLTQEIERLQSTIQTLEQKGQQDDDQQKLDTNVIVELKEEMRESHDKNEHLKEYLAKTESQMDFLQKQQNLEISEIEGRLESVVDEIKQLKYENGEMKKKGEQQKKQIEVITESEQDFKEKFLKQKQTCKNLKVHIKEVEDKVKEFQQERAFEVRENDRQSVAKQKTEQQTQKKIRLLNEIQNMIKLHKSSSTLSTITEIK